MIPKWRKVRYTDDGCNLYQCLSCYNEWEDRDAPGWWDTFVDTDCLVEGGNQYTKDGKEHYFATRSEPLYNPSWKFCPYCGIEWDGSVRCDIDNERMLGGRRALAHKEQRYRPWEAEDPGYWFVVFSVEVHCSGMREKQHGPGIAVEKIHPRYGAKAALKHTKGMDVKTWQSVGFPGTFEERFTLRIWKSEVVDKISYLKERTL